MSEEPQEDTIEREILVDYWLCLRCGEEGSGFAPHQCPEEDDA